MEPLPSSSSNRPEEPSCEFLSNLMQEFGVSGKKRWHNNNSTLHERAYILELPNLTSVPADVLSLIFHHNQASHHLPHCVVPVAGWGRKPTTSIVERLCPCFSIRARQERLEEEYAQSFSLSPFTTATHADVILRTQKAAQKMEVIRENGDILFRVSAGVRITDADQFLLKKGLALPPNMPTLHVASLVGAAANGCYGPGRDYGPMTTNIAEMKVISPLGKRMTLSPKEHPNLFHILRDCHMGAACFVREITLKNIEPKFAMRRVSTLFTDIAELKAKFHQQNLLGKEHFILMYIPVDIEQEGENHCPRIQVSTFSRTDQQPTKETACQKQRDLCDYLSLMVTEAGEPLIDLIVKTDELRQFMPFVLKSAALKTYGVKKETVEIDWSASVTHLLRTYTDLPIKDINWLIQVNSTDEAKEVLIALLDLTEDRLKSFARQGTYPLFNAFARYLKGLLDPEGIGGVAHTAIDHVNQSILSFELLTYSPLAETEEFKGLVTEVIHFLNNRGLKFHYHPGKDHPEGIRSLTQIFTDAIDQKRLQNFQNAVIELHGGRENLDYSPLLTPQKRVYLGFEEPNSVCPQRTCNPSHGCSEQQRAQALQKIIQLAKEEGNQEIQDLAKGVIETQI